MSRERAGKGGGVPRLQRGRYSLRTNQIQKESASLAGTVSKREKGRKESCFRMEGVARNGERGAADGDGRLE